MMDGFTRVRWLAVVGVLLLAGCSWTGSLFKSDKAPYEGAKQSSAPLEVPPDLSQLPRDDRFVVPDRPQTITASGQQARPAPGATSAGMAAPAVVPPGTIAKIERDGSQRWLAVNLPPDRVWPVLVAFWPTVGMKIEKEDATTGIVETGWAETRPKVPQGVIRRALGSIFETMYSTGEMDKYRARIERTPQNTSEVFISHRGLVEVYVTPQQDQTKWTSRPSDPELEAAMLQRLAVQFDASAATPMTAAAGAPPAAAGTAPASATAAPAPAPLARVVKGTDGRTERLEVDDSFDRAWRRVGLALDRGSFTVEDRDRAKGIYFVRYLDPDYEAKAKSEQGFFTKFFSSDKPIPALQYRVVLTGQSTNRTVVTVLSADGKPERSTAGDRILALLNDQLR